MVLNRTVRAGLIEKMPFEQRLEGSEGISQDVRAFQEEGTASAKTATQEIIWYLSGKQRRIASVCSGGLRQSNRRGGKQPSPDLVRLCRLLL